MTSASVTPSHVRQIELQGHRGALTVLPGNTLTGFAHTLSLGVTSIEIDVWLTTDGQLAVYHDDKVRRSYGDVSPHDLPLAEIPVLTDGLPEVPEHRAPTLAETLALFRFAGATDVVLDVEIKSDFNAVSGYPARSATATARVLEPHLGEQAIRVRSFDRAVLATVAQVAPRIERFGLQAVRGDEPKARALGYLPANAADAVDLAEELGLTGLAPRARMIDRAWVDAVHAAGVRVISWDGGETPDAARELLDAGVDGLCVDDPAALRALLEADGYPVPEPRPFRLPALMARG